jgi:hypothetical protein
MGAPQPPEFSWVILLSLLAVLAASGVTFWLLMRRMTSHRQWVALSDWAREHRFKFARSETGEPPPPLTALRGAKPKVRLQLTNGPTTLVQLESEATAATGAAPSPPATAAARAAGGTRASEGAGDGQSNGGTSAPVAVVTARRDQVTWNLLVRKFGGEWPPTGLRPTNAAASALDLFSLSSFPTLAGTERFIAYGTDSSAARVLSKSMLRSLLPPDVGLLLHGGHLVLDFSGRPFDAIEFGRMISLADQLANHVPPLGTVAGKS